MNSLDWVVLLCTISFIAIYGTWRTRQTKTAESYLKGDQSLKWWMIGVSIIATQASAVTFLSVPGQAMEDGMGFLQFYFGLPVAMVIISITFVPIYYRLKVYTAYEYLESRFDLKTRILAALLFFVLRGLSVGITLFAPALVLSTILRWPILLTTILIGTFVIIYVVSGGTKAVSLTQRQQMAVIMSGMILAGILAVLMLPENVSFGNAVSVAGELGKLNLVNIKFDLTDRYNIWSGLIAGTFLSLAYFGTDQSQVARYLGGASVAESRLGLLFNGLLKIPMQFIILFIGIMVYVFFLFNQPPLYHNQVLREQAMQTPQAPVIQNLESEFERVHADKRVAVDELVNAIQTNSEEQKKSTREKVKSYLETEKKLRDSVRSTIKSAIPLAKTKDTDYIFLNFVLTHLPHGIIGLLLAVMFCAAMSSMAGELNALASTTSVDIYKRLVNKTPTSEKLLVVSRVFTIVWAVVAMLFAIFGGFEENLIQFVNIVGSLIYGTLLGIFLCAFYFKRLQGTAVFYAGIISESIILYCYKYTKIAFLLYNIIGCATVIIFALIIQAAINLSASKQP